MGKRRSRPLPTATERAINSGAWILRPTSLLAPAAKMKAIQLEQPKQFRRIEVPEAAQPAPGEALVRVHRIGICGTDYGGFLGKMPFYSYPRIPGHELGVEVLAVGNGVTNVAPGDRCSVEPYMNCQECHPCRRGSTNCCENLKVLGVMTDGGMRERFIVPARKLHKSAKLSFEQLALVETLAIGSHAVNRANPQKGDYVLIIGAGPIGLSVIEFVKLSGARTIVLDLIQHRLDFCRNVMHVDETILVNGNELEELKRATNGSLAQIVIDATGSNK